MPEPSLLDDLKAELAGRYDIDGELGRGGMATVYSATDLRHQRRVAIKLLAAEFESPTARERFAEEVRIVASLTHPNIVPLFDSGATKALSYFVMPLLEGESLRGRFARETQLPLADAASITREIAGALAYAHDRGIVHRDVKPDNILIHDGHALITDFGVARAATGRSATLTGTGISVGTPAYMSPEQISGDPKVDARSDQYSLALVLYEMLAGDRPFEASTPQASLSRKLHGDWLAVHPVRPTVSREVDQVLRRALSPTAADRYPDVREFAKAAEAALQDQSAGPRRSIAVRHLVAIGAVVLGVLLIGTVARRLWRTSHLDASTIAVFPFRATAGVAADWTEGVPDLLATALEGTAGLRVLDPWSLWRQLRATASAAARTPDPDEAATIAQSSGAGRFVLGALVQNGDSLQVTVRLYAVGAAEPVRTVTLSAAAGTFTPLVEKLALTLIGSLTAAGDSSQRLSLERYTTRSVEALKAYVAARAAMRRGMIDSADRAIDHAIALDSSFALALVDAITIKSWAQSSYGRPYSGLRELVTRAERFSDSLTVRNRLRIVQSRSLIETDGRAAFEAGNKLVALDSTDFDAWNGLAYTSLVHGWQYGGTIADAAAAADHLVALDPANPLAHYRRAWIALEQGDSAVLRGELTALRTAGVASPVVHGALLGMEMLLVPDEIGAVLVDSIAALDQVSWIAAYRTIRNADPARAMRLLGVLQAKAAPGFPARLVAGSRAQMELAGGRFGILDSLSAPGATAQFPGFLDQVQNLMVASAVSGIAPGPLAARAESLVAAGMPVDSAQKWFNTHNVWNIGWLVGAYSAMYGDTLVTKRWQAAIDAFPAGGSPREWRAALRTDLEARLAARRGDTRAALAGASRALSLWSVHTENTIDMSPEPQMRFFTARLLRAQGMADSAAKVFRSLTPPTTWLMYLTPLAATELGEIDVERGRCNEATGHFNAALRLWSDTTGAMRPARDRAVAGLRKCGEDRGR